MGVRHVATVWSHRGGRRRLRGVFDEVFPGSAKAESHFRAVASGAKSVQFKMARVANGRTVDVTGVLAAMADSWQSGMDAVVSAAR